MQDRLTELLEPCVEGLGYELLLLEVLRGSGTTLRLYIDRPAGAAEAGVGIGDCEKVSRQVSALLEVEDPISSEYTLEVSSPGWDRPLRKAAHFAEYSGWEAKVMLAMPMDGRRKFRGIIDAVDEQSVRLIVDGEPFDLPMADIERARLVFDEERYKEEQAEVELAAAGEPLIAEPVEAGEQAGEQAGGKPACD